VQPVNEHYPELVTKYTPGAKVALTPEQLERLRPLGCNR